MGLHQQVSVIEPNRVFGIAMHLRRFDAEGDTLNTIFSISFQIDAMDLRLGGLGEKTPLYTQDNLGRIWQTRPRTDTYEVNVWNPDGSLDRVVKREFDLIKKTEEEIEEERELVMRTLAAQAGGELPPDLNISYEPDPNRAATGFPYFDPHGYTWVQVTKEGTHDANAFDIFDLEGRYLKRVEIPGISSPLFIKFIGTRLVAAELNPEATPQVIHYRLTIDE